MLCTISGSFSGILGLICGFFAGMIFEKILGSLLEEKRLASFLEAGRLENFAGQGFPGALYVSALVMFCLDDVEDSVFQLTRSLPQKNRATVPGPVWLPMVVPML